MSRHATSGTGRQPNGSPALHLNRVDEWRETSGLVAILRRAARAGLAAGAGPPREELSITFVSEREIRELNSRFLDRDETTDVLAFDLGSHGDVYIAPEAARRAASERGIPFAEELVRLVVHAALHLAGHDHPEDETRTESEMFRMQEELVSSLCEEPGA